MPACVGLELGDRVVRAVTLERQGSKVRLTSRAEVAIAGDSPDAAVAAVKRLRKTLPITHPVIVGLPTRLAVVATVEPLVVNRQRANLAIQFELQEHLPYEASQAVWHYHWLNGSVPPKHAVVAALKRSLLEERITICQRAGLAVQAVGVTCIASVNAWLRQTGSAELARGLLLHVDGAMLEWIAVSPSGLHVSPMLLSGPISGLAQSGPGQAPYVEQVRDAIKTSWEHVQEQGYLSPPAAGAAGPVSPAGAYGAGQALWLSGDSTSFPQLSELLKRELGCRIEILNPSRVASSAPGKAAGESLVVACGLALQGLGLARIPMNLLAEIMQARRVKYVRRATAAISWVLALLAAGFAANGMMAMLRARQALLDRLTKQEQQYHTLRPDIRAMLQVQEQYRKRLQQLAELASARPLAIQAFRQLVEVLPEEAWLTKVELTKGRTVEGSLEGYAKSFQGVTRLMDQLKSTVGWPTVKLLGTNVVTDPTTSKELVVFTVQLQQPLANTPAAEGQAPAEPAENAKPSKTTGSTKARPAASASKTGKGDTASAGAGTTASKGGH